MTRRESLRLIDARVRGGVASKLEVQDATSLVAQAEQSIAELERLRTRSENARWYAPLTLATFDFGMAVVDRRRVGIVARTGED